MPIMAADAVVVDNGASPNATTGFGAERFGIGGNGFK